MPYLVNGLLDVRAKLALRDGLVVETVPCASVLRPSAPEHESAAAEGRHSPDQTAMIGSIPTSSKNSRYSSRPRPLGTRTRARVSSATAARVRERKGGAAHSVFT